MGGNAETVTGWVKCTLCPKECELGPGDRGNCRARVNIDGKLLTLVYGKPCAVHIDPIEKKPMFHFLPGTSIFSIATAGCNLHCKFCQNWDISQKDPEDTENGDLPPDKVVQAARYSVCNSIAYTYSEPMIFFEYTRDASSIARQAGLKNILVTAGYISEKPLRELCKVTDGANLDIKAFSDDYYRNVCDGDLATVLKTFEVMKEEGVFLEITNLIVPTLNDDPGMIRDLCRWLVKNGGPDVPLHFSRFFPMYLMRNLYPTPQKTLETAKDIAKEEGLHFVYVGNVPGVDEDTNCPNCGAVLISRVGYSVTANKLVDGHCPDCNAVIAGVWK